jgi:hypothetical protein
MRELVPRLRTDVLRRVRAARTSHAAGCLSMPALLAVLYGGSVTRVATRALPDTVSPSIDSQQNLQGAAGDLNGLVVHFLAHRC